MFGYEKGYEKIYINIYFDRYVTREEKLNNIFAKH
jgi:hypothetical protein